MKQASLFDDAPPPPKEERVASAKKIEVPTAAEIIARTDAWIAALTDPDLAAGRFEAERPTREACGVTLKEERLLKAALDGTVNRLRTSGTPRRCGTCVHRNAGEDSPKGYCEPSGEERGKDQEPCDMWHGFAELRKTNYGGKR